MDQELNEKLTRQGPDTVPATTFSYWGLIRDVIESANEDPDRQQLLSVAEYCLHPLSWAASVTSLSPKKNSSKPSSVIIDRSESLPSAPVTSLYPSLLRDPSPSDMPLINPVFKRPHDKEPLGLENTAAMEEEVVLYHNSDQLLLTPAPPRGPPPYIQQ